MKASVFFGFLFCFFAPPSKACTTFQLSKSEAKVVAKSYDWNNDSGFVSINKKNVQKKAFLVPSLQPGVPAEWKSSHASVTFNQFGTEFPASGMNDAGLVVEVMVLNETKTAEKSDLPTVGELQWVQYQLDNFASVQEMIDNQTRLSKENPKRVRIAPIYIGLHYMACDATGACASFEYLDGDDNMTINGGDKNSFPALTNSTYKESVETYQAFLKSGAAPPEKCVASLDRFVCIADFADKFDSKLDAIPYAFKGLQKVWVEESEGSKSVWNIVYEPGAKVKKVHFRTRGSAKIKTVLFEESRSQTTGYNPSCTQVAQIYDMNADEEGDVTGKFKDFTIEENQAYFEKAIAGIPQLKDFVKVINTYLTGANLECKE